MATTVTLYDRDGNSFDFDAADFAQRGHQEQVTAYGETDQRFIISLLANALNTSAAFMANSTDSLTIGTGSKSLTVEKNKPFFVDAFVRVEQDGAPDNFMEGPVTAYDESTGALTVDVQVTGGAGTISDWKIKTLGKRGAFGRAGMIFDQSFDTGTTDADPGAGNVRANNADLSAVTEFYVDDADRDGNDIQGLVDTWDDSTSMVKGQLILQPNFESSAFVLYNVTGITDATGYTKVQVSHLAGSGTAPFSADDVVNIGFARTGDKGDTGDVGGPVSSNDNAIARWDGTDGNAIQDSGWTLSDGDALTAGGPFKPQWLTKTAAYTVKAGERILADTSGGALTVTLPASPATGDTVLFADAASSWDTNNLTVDGNGNNVLGEATFVADVKDWPFGLVYNGTQWVFADRS